MYSPKEVPQSLVKSRGPYPHCKILLASVQRMFAGLVQQLRRSRSKDQSGVIFEENKVEVSTERRESLDQMAHPDVQSRPNCFASLIQWDNSVLRNHDQAHRDTYLLSLSVETRTGVRRLCCDPKMPFTVSVDLKLSAELAVDPWRAASVSLLVMAVWFQFLQYLRRRDSTRREGVPVVARYGYHSDAGRRITVV